MDYFCTETGKACYPPPMASPFQASAVSLDAKAGEAQARPLTAPAYAYYYYYGRGEGGIQTS